MKNTSKSNSIPRLRFADDEAANHLASLVLSGQKTATCSALSEYLSKSEPLPVLGQQYWVEDALGVPQCMIEVTEVRIVRFDEVDEAFAKAEGEGDGRLETWRKIHQAYFSKHKTFSTDMLLVCEKFRRIIE